MDQDRWKEVNRIFHDALALSASERRRFVISSSNGDEDLRKEVEHLLQADVEAGSYLEKPLIAETSDEKSCLRTDDLLCRRFRVIREIAEGGMGRVYEAFDSELGVGVALKVIRPEIASDPRALARFRQEVKLARTITHPNVCRTFDIERDFLINDRGEQQEVVFLTMEFLDGETLSAFLKREGRISTALAITLAGQIAGAIDAAHDLGIVHRDLKPGNVMLVSPGQPESGGQMRAVITDFGLARFTPLSSEKDPSTTSNSFGWPEGTMAYMAPEQLQGLPADPGADIYAFGLILFEMIAGKRAFPAESFLEGIEERVRGPASSLNEQLQEQSQSWREAISWCLRANSSERAASAAAVVEVLTGTRKAPRFSEGLRSGWKRTAIWLGVVLFTAVPAWYFYRPQSTLRMLSYQQLTRDGKQKFLAGSDGTWVYMTGGATPLSRFSVRGGEVESISNQMPATAIADWEVSQDGSKALVPVLEKESQISLWSAPIHGGSPTLVAIGDNLSGTFTSDGNSILYLTGSGDLHLVRGDGTDDHKLASLNARVNSARMSPDGTRIRFFRDSGIWEMPADGGTPHKLFPSWHAPSNLCCGRWSFDGGLYAFLEQKAGDSNQIWGADEHRSFFHRPSNPVQLTNGPMEWDGPISGKKAELYAVGRTYRGELERVDLRSGELHPYLGGLSVEHVAFSPDGNFVAYCGYPIRFLWRANRDGSNRMQLTSGSLSSVMNPTWSPDGRQILFMNAPLGGATKAYLLPGSGGTAVELLPGDNETEADPHWSPDGKQIVMSGGDPFDFSRQYLRILDLTTHRITIVPGSQGYWSPRWSPDGHYLAALYGVKASLRIFSFVTRRWVNLKVPELASYPTFSKDSKYLYYLRTSSGDSARGIYRIHVDGGEPEKIFDLAAVGLTILWGPSMSLDPYDVPLVTRDLGSSDAYSLQIGR